MRRRAGCLKLAADERTPKPEPAAAGSILAKLIALAALIVSALGVWIAWQGSSKNDAHEGRRAAIRGARWRFAGPTDGDGRTLTIMPADPGHALQSLG